MDQVLEKRKGKWQLFTDAWAVDDREQRIEMLKEAINGHCVYADQYIDVTGYEGIANYIEEFQKSVQGAHFEVTSYSFHGYQCLANWNLVNKDGKLLKQGTGYGRYEMQGKLLVITYFLNNENG